MSVTAPRDYPVEVHLGYLEDGVDFISAVAKAGKEYQEWVSSGGDAGMSASRMPSFLELTWLSYLNGEMSIRYAEELVRKEIFLQTVPGDARLIFGARNAEVFFDGAEIMAACRQLAGPDRQTPLEIIGKVAFMYKDISFAVKNAEKEVPLEKVKVRILIIKKTAAGGGCALDRKPLGPVTI